MNIQNACNLDTPLHKAAYRGDLETCRLLIDYGADVSIINSQNKTPIQEALGQRHQRVAELLLRSKRCEGGFF